jgi:DNA mismatch endonuclease (patch repair protein)
MTAAPRLRRDPEITSRMMAAVRNKNSVAELALRHALHARGVRYRLHARDVVGRPDIVIRKFRLAVFIDGDMWHGNAWRLRGLARMEDMFPTRTEWWVSKINGNIERDRLVTRALEGAGWRVVRVWESDVLNSPDDIAEALERYVRDRRRGRRAPQR